MTKRITPDEPPLSAAQRRQRASSFIQVLRLMEDFHQHQVEQGMRRSLRAVQAAGRLLPYQLSADHTISMFGFDFRQGKGQPALWHTFDVATQRRLFSTARRTHVHANDHQSDPS